MKKILIPAALAIFAIEAMAAAAQSDHDRVTRDMQTPAPFSRIILSSGADVEWTPSIDGASSVTIIAPREVMDELDIHIDNGTLHVGRRMIREVKTDRHGNVTRVGTRSTFGWRDVWNGLRRGDFEISNIDDVRVIASSPSLDDIELSGSGDIEIDGGIATNGDVRIEVGGAGSVDIDELRCRTLDISLSGAGGVDIEHGIARNASYRVSGVGSVDAGNMMAESVVARVSGVGGVTCHAATDIDAQVSGIGRIDVYGHPARVGKRSSGIGAVNLR